MSWKTGSDIESDSDPDADTDTDGTFQERTRVELRKASQKPGKLTSAHSA